MATDAHLAEFYASRRGAVAARLVGDRLRLIWPTTAREAVLGLGYAAPYLPLWREEAERCIALIPAQFGPVRSSDRLCCTICTAGEDALPFPDLCFDRILLVHGLEAAEHARRMLREVWRVLRDCGRLLVVAPNRRGMWAHLDSTPFGQGQPYSHRQIDRLLASASFRVERRDTALYLPPADWAVILRAAAVWERLGRRYAQGFAGVTITEAVKDAYAAVPAEAVARRRMVLADAS
ncbi:MAG: methyltransferase domain-containing protein [Acidisphaera sp.]|nr:methyltransferase domain-containing protein [Acidisphaera sp.]MBV9811404.1 methyltransferase domain-containing protein [Acetobacteraceae bacterium]